MEKSYRTEGIVLKRINYGETDRILTFYTKHYGKIRALAKGARKLTSRKGGNVELFNRVIVFLHRGRNLDILSEVQVLDSFKIWRQDLKKVATAYYFCELVDRLTPDGQANRVVYELLSKFLGRISQENLSVLTRSFEEKLLKELGFGVPEGLQKNPNSLKNYIETIIEKKIQTTKILRRL